jgi:hypothetical protein
LEIAVSSRFWVVRVLVLTGAGVSAESGIATFRGKDGYWRNLDPIRLATPEAFTRDPELVWQWYRERRQRIRNAQPNAAHEAIAKLAQCADEFLLVTQNVDDLHGRAGLAKAEMVQIHGDIFATKCSRCDFKQYDYRPSVAAATYGAPSDNAFHLVFQEREKFGTCTGIVFKSAQKTGGLHDRVLFLNAPHHHAKMLRFYYHGHAGGFQTIHERLGDLRRKIFLDLQTPREDIDNARHLGKANHFPVWKVSHMRATDEGKQMVLTQRIKLNVFD